MKTEALIFIHPNDFLKLLREENGPISVITEGWVDGLKILRIHGVYGVPYRVTDRVPEVLTSEHYSDIINDPPTERFKDMIYGCRVEDWNWPKKNADYLIKWHEEHPDWVPNDAPTMADVKL